MLCSALGQRKLGTGVLVIGLPEVYQFDEEVLDDDDVAGRDIQMRNLITLQEPYRVRQVREYV